MAGSNYNACRPSHLYKMWLILMEGKLLNSQANRTKNLKKGD